VAGHTVTRHYRQYLAVQYEIGDKMRVVICLYIDQDIAGEVDTVIDRYIDELALAKGDLTWGEVDYFVIPEIVAVS
jgi:hypothetical protein